MCFSELFNPFQRDLVDMRLSTIFSTWSFLRYNYVRNLWPFFNLKWLALFILSCCSSRFEIHTFSISISDILDQVLNYWGKLIVILIPLITKSAINITWNTLRKFCMFWLVCRVTGVWNFCKLVILSFLSISNFFLHYDFDLYSWTEKCITSKKKT